MRAIGESKAIYCECGDHAFAEATRGATVLVSPEDGHLLDDRHWSLLKSGYICGRIGNKTKYLHRVVMNATPHEPIDHERMNKWDNRRSKLRHCVKSQNAANRTKQANNKSGYKGVFWNSQKGKWCASICKDRKRKVLGHFTDPLLAARVYDQAAVAMFGRFARTNGNA